MPNENEEPPRRPRRSWADFFAERSVVDIMALAFTVLVAISILATGATVAAIEIVSPESDTSAIVDSLTTTITTIVGALLGLIAGKGESKPPAPPP